MRLYGGLVNGVCRRFVNLSFFSNSLFPRSMSGEEPLRKLRRNCDVVAKIGTHDGVFHCDDVLGCFMLKLLHPNAEIVRSRDEDVLKTCDIVIDVGSVYDPKINRYDHHQRGFNESMNTVLKNKKWKTKLSSAGLIYCHFGTEILNTILKNNGDDIIDEIFDKVYEDFIQEIDGIDNGIPMYDGEPVYRITTNLSARVHRLNKKWNETEYNEVEQFEKAMKLAGGEFTERVLNCRNIWWPAKDEVTNAIKNRYNVHPSGEIMELKAFVPWKDHYFDLETKLNVKPQIKFVIFIDVQSKWRVQAVSLNTGSFILRLPLCEEWRGLRDEELSKISGIDGCVFVHHSGFIGGNKTRNGVLQMAIKTLELANKQ
ncbi:MYG1 protein-like isoform X2 [Lycorma delicatula]|uniref:MYG1 protein-like isoform X2 n=1 Tax=Lycorma delicatula TaxID=130591 RepID=UPI003F51652A